MLQTIFLVLRMEDENEVGFRTFLVKDAPVPLTADFLIEKMHQALEKEREEAVAYLHNVIYLR